MGGSKCYRFQNQSNYWQIKSKTVGACKTGDLTCLWKNAYFLIGPENQLDQTKVSHEDIIYLCFGPKSSIGKILWEQLELSPENYTKFMATFFMQALYKVSSTQIFDKDSMLSHKALLSEKAYNEIWFQFVTKKKRCQSNFVEDGRRDWCVWEYLEDSVNNLCRMISISNQTGKI